MTLRMTALNVRELAPGIWALEMPPHQIRHFGSTNHAVGPKSVLMLRSCEYDGTRGELSFNVDDVTPINIGTTPQAIGIKIDEAPAKSASDSSQSKGGRTSLGPGDRGFLELARAELSETTAAAAEKLLLEVRRRHAGDLKRGQSRNFSETPDNFWYVIVQPRVDELSITVRGPVERFEGRTPIEVKDDRGNTRFKVRGPEDVPKALDLIFHAVRKQ